jgi:hypothetical protein
MIKRINSKLAFKAFLFFVFISVFGATGFAQTSLTATIPETKRKNVLESYFENTIFKIKDEKGNTSAEKRFNDLNLAEKKALPNIFFDERRLLSKEEIIDKLQKGGPEFVEINLSAEKYKAIKSENGIYKTADLTEKPTYPGGMEEFYKFAGKNFKVPKTPENVLLKGKIFVTFIVQEDGSLTDLKVLKDLGFSTGEEALRVLKLSQKWIPGKLDGKAVAAQYSLPMSIQSTE